MVDIYLPTTPLDERSVRPSAAYAAALAAATGGQVHAEIWTPRSPVQLAFRAGPSQAEIDAENAAIGARAARLADMIRARLGAAGRVEPVECLASEVAARAPLRARAYDVTVVDQPAGDDALVTALLHDSGRPVIVVPETGAKAGAPRRVVAAWDGSRSAARALGDALALTPAGAVYDIVTVGDDAGADEAPAAAVVRRIERRGGKAEVVALPAGGRSIGDVLATHAAKADADLLVMGGYGHSLLRERLLGGVTRTILAAPNTATLLSH
jgi:nucleotide-binding universal stress UspA family protein